MSAKKVLKFIREKEAEFVDLRFTDPRGKLQHLTMDTSIVDEKLLNDGGLSPFQVQRYTQLLKEQKERQKP